MGHLLIGRLVDWSLAPQHCILKHAWAWYWALSCLWCIHWSVCVCVNVRQSSQKQRLNVCVNGWMWLVVESVLSAQLECSKSSSPVIYMNNLSVQLWSLFSPFLCCTKSSRWVYFMLKKFFSMKMIQQSWLIVKTKQNRNISYVCM